jgi:signal transduction histidine kinase
LPRSRARRLSAARRATLRDMSLDPEPLYVPRPPTILMVDDRPANLVALGAVLAPLGCPLISAGSGEEALKHLLDSEVAVILLDVQMPGLDGFETAKLIRARERTRHIPILFVTAINRDEAHVFRGYLEGAVDYLMKPLDPDILRSKVSVFVQLFTRGEALREKDALLHRRAQEAWKDELLSAMSHELRTPLNAILGWVQLLRGGGLAELQQRRGLEVIERNARAQAQLISDVLDASRIVTGTLLLERGPVDLGAITGEAVEAARPSAVEKRVALTAEIEDTTKLEFVGDAERLRQVVRNLLANAIQFTPAGGCVGVRLHASPEEVVIAVTDTGQGIRRELLPQIFERFRGGEATAGMRHGLGLGLFITERLCALHRGRIIAESPGEGRGATFTVHLPRAAGPAGARSRARGSAR